MRKLIIILLFSPLLTIAQYPYAGYYINKIMRVPSGIDTIFGKVGGWDTNYVRRNGSMVVLGLNYIKQYVNSEQVNQLSLGAVEVVSTVGEISTLSNAAADVVVVTDTLRGGTFNRYTGSDAADGGMVFTDALGGKWKRVVTDGISIAWYGGSYIAT